MPALNFARFKNWLFQWRGPEPGPIVLSQRRVFIMPRRSGVMFAAALLIMLVGSINYMLSLGFALTFLLAALGINSIFYTFRNLAQLRIAPGRTMPAFAGETVRFTLHIKNTSELNRYAIGISHTTKFADAPKHATYFDVPALQTTTTHLSVVAERRGWLTPGRFTIFTTFPLGLCRAWGYADLGIRCLIYPKPALDDMPLPFALTPIVGNSNTQHGAGDEDFAGLRDYHPSDAPGHVAWKSVARDDLMRSKQFSGSAVSEITLDWFALPTHMDDEARLSQLTRWVLDAHNAGLRYNLRLPNVEIESGSGDAQRERCLEVLALYE